MTNEQLQAFEESERCTGCSYCFSGKYMHPLGYKWAIKKIAGKEEAWIIFGSMGIALILGIILIIYAK